MRYLINICYPLQAIEILRNSQGTVQLKVRKCGTDSLLNSHPPTVFQMDSIPGKVKKIAEDEIK
jgi:hypothetical protein